MRLVTVCSNTGHLPAVAFQILLSDSWLTHTLQGQSPVASAPILQALHYGNTMCLPTKHPVAPKLCFGTLEGSVPDME